MSEDANEVKEPCQECAGECGLVCECSNCDCKHSTYGKLSKETALFIAEFTHREKGVK